MGTRHIHSHSLSVSEPTRWTGGGGGGGGREGGRGVGRRGGADLGYRDLMRYETRLEMTTVDARQLTQDMKIFLSAPQLALHTLQTKHATTRASSRKSVLRGVTKRNVTFSITALVWLVDSNRSFLLSSPVCSPNNDR